MDAGVRAGRGPGGPARAWAALLLVGALWLPAPAAGAATAHGVLPVPGAVVRSFDPPDVPWGAGHRGVDLAASDGAVVVAPADGVVTFAEVLAGRPVLVVSHGELRSTFEPVVATVAVGTRVGRGQPVGRLVAGHACPAPVCLHWGVKRGETYLNPLGLLGREVRLVSDAEAAAIAIGGSG
jgi:murein DD-endopeptidase MepM/ murein hydrolase activator NlpD